MEVVIVMEEKRTSDGRYLSGFLTGVLGTLIVVLLALIIVVMIFGNDFISKNRVGTVSVDENKELEESMGYITEKVGYLAGFISTYYLDEVKTEDIVEGIYKGIFESIGDPYSEYYTKEEYKEIMESTSGEFVGIGVSLIYKDEKDIVVTGFLEGSNAKKAGMEIDDIIIKVDDKDITNVDFDNAVSMIKGDEGTDVKIGVKRMVDGKAKEFDFMITRAVVSDISVYSNMEDNNIGYIYITGFDGNTPQQFEKHLKELQTQGMKGLVLDIRYNGGGMLDSVQAIADAIMDKGVLLTMKDKSGTTKRVVETEDGKLTDVPVVVLVNEYSASASEVLAGAIKDRNVGEIIGVTTFGKGIVQTIIPLNDGSAIKITTERYYTPSGDYIHEKGITPDYVVEVDEEKAKEGIDNQLEKAKEVLGELMK